MDSETVRAMLLRNLGRAADDPVGSHDMYDEEAVLEFPQSGERFEGLENIREWRSRYPGSVTDDIGRIRGGDDIDDSRRWWGRACWVSCLGGSGRTGRGYQIDMTEPSEKPLTRHPAPDQEPGDTDVQAERQKEGVEAEVAEEIVEDHRRRESD